MIINIKDVKKGQIVRFENHSHEVCGEGSLDCSGHLGEVVEVLSHVDAELEISVKLKSNTYAHTLHEWDNCLIFRFPDDECYDDVKVTVINAKVEDDTIEEGEMDFVEGGL
jgi:hypothetical protein